MSRVDFAEPVHEEDEVGAKRAIDQQFATPMAIRSLLSQQILLGARDRLRNSRFDSANAALPAVAAPLRNAITFRDEFMMSIL